LAACVITASVILEPSAGRDTAERQLAQDFLRAYQASRHGLTTLGILRSERVLQGDYAEWIAARVLGLTLAHSGVQKGYDATDGSGRTYQVKSRIVRSLEERTSFDITDVEARFDFLIGVLFTPALEVLAIMKISFDAAVRRCNPTSTTYRLRWNRKSAADPDIEYLYRAETEQAPAVPPAV
jgi:hypothetical protein